LSENFFKNTPVPILITYVLNNSDLSALFMLSTFLLLGNKKKLLFIISAWLIFINSEYLITYKKMFWVFEGLNLDLMNGIIIIHPPLIYFCMTFFGLEVIKKNCFYTRNYEFKLNNSIGLGLAYTALVTGSFWAQQELNWGG